MNEWRAENEWNMLEMNTVVEIERKAELMLLTLYNKMNIFYIKLK